MVIVAGALAGAGDLNVFLVIVAAWAGAVVGDNISYGIGKWRGRAHGEAALQREKAHRASTGPSSSSSDAGATSSWSRASSRSGGPPSRSRPATRTGCPWHRFVRYDARRRRLWATYATMLGYIGGKQFEEQPWKGVLLGLGDRVHRRVRDRVVVRDRRAKRNAPAAAPPDSDG